MGMIDPPRERVAVLAGATGLVGGFCLDLLLSSPRYELVHALGRRPPDRDHERLNKIETDFSDLAEAGLGHLRCWPPWRWPALTAAISSSLLFM